MAKDNGIIIDVGFSSENINDFIKDIKTKLDNAEFSNSIGIEDAFKEQIKNIKSELDVLKKEIKESSNPTSVTDLKKQYSELQKSVKTLYGTVRKLGENVPTFDASGILSDMKEINNIAGDTVSAVDELVNIGKKNNSKISIIDNKEAEEAKNLYNELKKIIELSNKSVNFKNKDSDSLVNSIERDYAKLDELLLKYDDLNNFDTKKATEIQKNILKYINSIKNAIETGVSSYGEGFKKIDFELDGDFIPIKNIIGGLDAYLKEITTRLSARMSELKLKMKDSDIVEVEGDIVDNVNKEITNKKQLTVPLEISKSSYSNLYKNALMLIGNAQKKLDKNPLEITVKLVSDYLSKKNTNLLHKISENMSNIESEEVKKQLESLISDFQKQIDNQLALKVKIEAEQNVRNSISRLVTELQQEFENGDFFIYPHIKLSEEDKIQLKEDIGDLSKGVNVDISIIKDGEKTKDKKTITKELNVLTLLKSKIDAITESVYAKTDAFIFEGEAVTSSVNDEVSSLKKLHTELKNIIKGLNNFKKKIGKSLVINYNIGQEGLDNFVSSVQEMSESIKKLSECISENIIPIKKELDDITPDIQKESVAEQKPKQFNFPKLSGNEDVEPESHVIDPEEEKEILKKQTRIRDEAVRLWRIISDKIKGDTLISVPWLDNVKNIELFYKAIKDYEELTGKHLVFTADEQKRIIDKYYEEKTKPPVKEKSSSRKKKQDIKPNKELTKNVDSSKSQENKDTQPPSPTVDSKDIKKQSEILEKQNKLKDELTRLGGIITNKIKGDTLIDAPNIDNVKHIELFYNALKEYKELTGKEFVLISDEQRKIIDKYYEEKIKSSVNDKSSQNDLKAKLNSLKLENEKSQEDLKSKLNSLKLEKNETSQQELKTKLNSLKLGEKESEELNEQKKALEDIKELWKEIEKHKYRGVISESKKTGNFDRINKFIDLTDEYYSKYGEKANVGMSDKDKEIVKKFFYNKKSAKEFIPENKEPEVPVQPVVKSPTKSKKKIEQELNQGEPVEVQVSASLLDNFIDRLKKTPDELDLDISTGFLIEQRDYDDSKDYYVNQLGLDLEYFEKVYSQAVDGLIKQLGEDRIREFITGINKDEEKYADEYEEIALYPVKIFKDALGIASPATVMVELGFWTIAGFNKGLKENTYLVEDTLYEFTEDIIKDSSKIRDALSKGFEKGILNEKKIKELSDFLKVKRKKQLKDIYSVVKNFEIPKSEAQSPIVSNEDVVDVNKSLDKAEEHFDSLNDTIKEGTNAAKEYLKIISQVGEFGVNPTVRLMWQLNDGQLISETYRASRDEDGNMLYDDPVSIITTKYNQIEKLLVKNDNEKRKLRGYIKDIRNKNLNLSTDNIKERIKELTEYNQLLEQTVINISKSPEYIDFRDEVESARVKAREGYNLDSAMKQERSVASNSESDRKNAEKELTKLYNELYRIQEIIKKEPQAYLYEEEAYISGKINEIHSDLTNKYGYVNSYPELGQQIKDKREAIALNKDLISEIKEDIKLSKQYYDLLLNIDNREDNVNNSIIKRLENSKELYSSDDFGGYIYTNDNIENIEEILKLKKIFLDSMSFSGDNFDNYVNRLRNNYTNQIKNFEKLLNNNNLTDITKRDIEANIATLNDSFNRLDFTNIDQTKTLFANLRWIMDTFSNPSEDMLIGDKSKLQNYSRTIGKILTDNVGIPDSLRTEFNDLVDTINILISKSEVSKKEINDVTSAFTTLQSRLDKTGEVGNKKDNLIERRKKLYLELIRLQDIYASTQDSTIEQKSKDIKNDIEEISRVLLEFYNVGDTYNDALSESNANRKNKDLISEYKELIKLAEDFYDLFILDLEEDRFDEYTKKRYSTLLTLKESIDSGDEYNKIDFNGDIKQIEEIVDLLGKLKSMMAEVDTLNIDPNNKNFAKFESRTIEGLQKQVQNLEKFLDNTKFTKEAKEYLLKNINTAKEEIGYMVQHWDMDVLDSSYKMVQHLKELFTKYSNPTDDMLAGNRIAIERYSKSINEILAKNGKMSSSLKNRFKDLDEYIYSLASKSEITKSEVNEVVTSFIRLGNELEKTGKKGNTFFQNLTKSLSSRNAQLFAQFFSFYDLIRYGRTAIETIRELDRQLVDLKKTTTMTSSDLNDFYYMSNDIAKQMGVTTSEIIQQASAFSRLGFSSKEASIEMAQLSSQFAAISPDMDVTTATDGLVSVVKAFDISVEDIERKVLDNINRIGNTAATSNGEIVDMLMRSSAAMKEGNNTLEETIALETAAVEITRSAETTGTAFKTISMRIRGYDEETEELSEDLQTISGDIADLTKTASNRNGISIFTDADKTNYKSTYQILKEISEIYDELTDKQQAELLEKLAGKRGGQVVGAVLNNFEAVNKALDNMRDAEGSADVEMKIIQESLDYQINNLMQTWVGIGQNLISKSNLNSLLESLSETSESIGDSIEDMGSGIDFILSLLESISDIVGVIFDSFGSASPFLLGGSIGIFKNLDNIKSYFTDIGKSINTISKLNDLNIDDVVAQIGLLSTVEKEFAVSSNLVDDNIKQIISNSLRLENASDSLSSSILKNKTAQNYIHSGTIDLIFQQAHLDSSIDQITLDIVKQTQAYNSLDSTEKKAIDRAFIIEGQNVALSSSFDLLTLKIKKNIAAFSKWLFTTPQGIVTLLVAATVGITATITQYNKKIKEARDTAVQNIDSIKNELDELNDLVDKSGERFAELAQGVENLGKANQSQGSLSTEEYEEFLGITSDLIDRFPTLYGGMNDAGVAMVNLSGDADTITSSLQNLLEVERQLANQKVVENMDEVLAGDIKDVKGYIGDIQSYEDIVNNILNNAENIKYAISNGYINASESQGLGAAINSISEATGADLGWIISGDHFVVDGITQEDKLLIDEYISQTIAYYEMKINSSRRDIDMANAQLRSMFGAFAASRNYTDEIYNGFISSLTYDMFTDENGKLLDDETIKNMVQESLTLLETAMDNSMFSRDVDLLINADVDAESMKEAYLRMASYLTKPISEGGLGLDSDNALIIHLRTLYDDGTSKYRDVADHLFANASVIRKHDLYSYYFEEISKLKDSDLDKLLNINIDSIPEDVLYSWDKLLLYMRNIPEESTHVQSSISTAVKNLSTQVEPQLSQLGSLFSSIFQYGEDGKQVTGIDWSKLDIGTVESLRKSFLELGEDIGFTFNEDYVNTFIDSLAQETATVDSVQRAFDKLATEYYYTTNTLKDLNDETAETIALTLRNQGVVNAYDATNYNLAAKAFRELAESENELTTTQIRNTIARIDSYISEINVTDENIEAIQNLQLQKILFSQGTIDSSEDVNNLISLANAAGISAKALSELASIREMYESYERVSKVNGTAATQIQQQIEERLRNYKQNLLDYQFELDIEVPSSASSSAGSAGKDAAETYVEEFEKELSVLEYLRTNGFIDEKEYLDQLRKLTEKYYKDKDQYAEQYYEKIHEYLEGIKSLYESAASAADDLLDKQITDYEELSEKATKTLEEQQEAAEKAIQDQIDAKQAELDLLNEANEKRQEELDLAKALYELERSKHQRTRLVNICQKLW